MLRNKTNSKIFKTNDLNPKYKHISKPDFWVYEVILKINPKFLPSMLRNTLDEIFYRKLDF